MRLMSGIVGSALNSVTFNRFRQRLCCFGGRSISGNLSSAIELLVMISGSQGLRKFIFQQLIVVVIKSAEMFLAQR